MSWLDSFFTSRNYGTVQDSGTALPPQPVLNFVGFDVENDTVNGRTNITNSGGAGGSFKGYEEIDMVDADHTVTDAEAENAILDCTGTMTGDHSLFFTQPSNAASQVHVVKNNTTGGFNIDVALTSGGGSNIISIGPGLSQLVEIRPTGVFNAVTGI